MKIVFISDLHLAPATTKHNQLLFDLLQSWQGKIDALYILGDFFDSWIGDDDDNFFIRAVKLHLSEFSRHTPIYFRGGNHDFALGKKFAQQTGMILLADMHTLQIGKNTLLLSHGDTFCSLDIGYQRMKKILQNRFTIFVLCQLPLRLRHKIKKMLEHKSAQQTNIRPQHIYQVVASTILKYAAKHQANIVIHGHTHRPGSYQLKNAGGELIWRYEIPDWQDHAPGGYLLLEDEKIQLIPAP